MRELIRPFLICCCSHFLSFAYAQNVGLGLLTPAGKLHIKGSANASQLIIDAHSTQGNLYPLIKLRKSSGTDLIWIHSDDSTNIFLGLKAGRANVIGPQGVNNTFIGSRAGYSNTNGRDNTIVGTNALFSNTKASQNTVVGTNALYAQSFAPGGAFWESKNVAVGHEALFSNQPTNTGNGQSNTAIGTSAMRSNTTGYQNMGIGAYALYLNTTGNFNTAAGYSALNSNTTGIQNTAVGMYAMFSNTGLSNNTALGYAALYSQANTPDGWLGANVAIGYKAMYNNYPTTYYEGAQNTAVGYEALTTNVGGYGNTAIGFQSLFSNYNGASNTAVGYHSLYENGGNWNTAVGKEALYLNYDGDENTAHGNRALYHNTTGEYNVAVGSIALWDNQTGDNNTAIGVDALKHNTTGNGNTAAGANSGTADYASTASNTVSIGNAGYLNGASNQAFLGNLSTAWNGGNMSWSTFSDARVKNTIREDVVGLDFISRLRPVTYYKSIEAMKAISGDRETADYPEKYDVEKIKTSGFLAQEVEQAASEAGYDFSGITIPKRSNELYTLSYEQFVVPLVKAVQEQQQEIDELKMIISNLQFSIVKLQTEHKTE